MRNRNSRTTSRRLQQLRIFSLALLLLTGVLYNLGDQPHWFAPSIAATVKNATPTAKARAKTPVASGAIYKVATNQKIVALTFDISWGEKAPGPILDILEQKGVKKATFFLSGPWTTTHAELAKRIKTMGFEIGNHGYKHDDFPKYPNAWIQDQVTKSEQAIFETTGVKTKLIRIPNGAFDKRVLQQLNSMGYTVIQWSTDSQDWKRPGAAKIINRVLTQAVQGDIILLHASDSAIQTIDALPKIIDGLRAKGYDFVTVSDLLANARVQSKEE